jgi:bifunctional non-homologous end joining protein LigD
MVALPQPIAEQALAIGDDEKQWLIDGEAIGDVYIAFDLLEYGGIDLRAKPYNLRLAALGDLISQSVRAIRLVDTAKDTASKRSKLAQFRSDNREGAVFKRFSAPYTPGRPSSGGDQLKLKFTATASCIVAKANGTKRSVALELLEGGECIAVGNVTIPPSQQIPQARSVVEIRYLYAYPGGSLFQPVYLGQRDDIDPSACIIGQLKYKAGEDEDESAREGGAA